MSDIENIIKEINKDISITNKKFISFDDETGDIRTISSRVLEGDNILEVETSEITDILNGIRSSNDFVVKYDINFKKYLLKDKINFNQSLTNDSYLYEIPKYSNDNLVFKREYTGIHVDVWYEELEHLKGQHIWYDNSVYMLLKDLKPNTKFQKKHFKLIIDNVKLYNDDNIYLEFNRNLKRKDLILNCNKIFSVHIDSTTMVEKSDIDCHVIQDNKSNFWSISLSETAKSVLKTSKENLNKTIIFSITSKDDPNLLYRFFQINLSDLVYKTAVTFAFQFSFEFDNEEVSIYTSKYFRNYLHEVI